jgi:hypothetical protein
VLLLYCYSHIIITTQVDELSFIKFSGVKETCYQDK